MDKNFEMENEFQEQAISNPLLSQDEIETLLSAVSRDEIGDKKFNAVSAEVTPGGSYILSDCKWNRRDVDVKKYDFVTSNYMSRDCIETLRKIHNNYAEKLSLYFSEILTATVNLECIHIEQLTYGEYLVSTMEPSCLGVFKMRTQNSFGIMEINSTCVFSLIDRLLGGSGLSKPYSRSLTSIEEMVIAKLIDKALKILSEIWRQNTDMKMELDRLVMKPGLARIAAMEDFMVLILFRFRLNDVFGMMNLCFPFEVVKKAFENIQKNKSSRFMNDRGLNAYEALIREHLLNTRVNISVRYETGSVTLGEFMGIQEGDIIKLHKADKDNVAIFVEGTRKFSGKPGVVDGQRAIQICEVKMGQ